MEISKMEKEELGNFFAACEQFGLLQYGEYNQSNASASVASLWCKVRFGFGCGFAGCAVSQNCILLTLCPAVTDPLPDRSYRNLTSWSHSVQLSSCCP
jgi:hypothetical protein